MNKYYINRFVDEYCESLNINRTLLFSKRRDRDLVEKRMILALFLRNRVELTWVAIGKIMNRNHASIIHYIGKIEDYLDVYPHLQRMFTSTNKLFQGYRHLCRNESDIYSQLLIDNERLKSRIESNEKLIKKLIKLNQDGTKNKKQKSKYRRQKV